MASCRLTSCEDQLLCSICFDVFKEPVTTPCGHNYCKTCITNYWDSCTQTRCPLCNRRYRHRPTLMINTHFRDMVEHLKNMSVICPPEELQAKPGEVSCDICLEPKLKALKSCLVCLTSYCQLHLEPHQRVSNLKKHKLTKPVPSLDDRVCKKHDKIFEFFCSVEKTCVCFVCLKKDHVAHETVPLELAFRKEKAHIERGIEEMKIRENVKTRSMNQIRSSVHQSEKNKDKDIADIGGVFTTLVDSLQKHKEDLVEVIELKHKEAVKNPEANVQRLLQEIIELKHKRAALEQLIKTEDCVQFFQRNPALLSASLTEDQLDSLPHSSSLSGYDHAGNEGYLNTVKTAAEHMEKILTREMDILIKKVKHCVDEDTDSDTACYKEIWIPPIDKLMMIQQNDSVGVTLDSYTNSARISIFAEGKCLMYVPISVALQHSFSLFNWRFENQPFALSVDGFSSGRFYYEVDVSEAKEWVLGVVRQNVNRYMHYRSLPSTREGAWIIGTLCRWTGGYHGHVPENLRLKKVGVFVDYEKGEVSFYDVDARSVIYSYTECTFNEPVPFLKSFLYGLAGGSVSNRTKLYPVFGVFSEFSVLKITPAVDLF